MALNLADSLAMSARDFADKAALICENYPMTYRELAESAQRVANILRRSGVEPGQKVAFMLPNTPHFPIILYGILWAGAVAVPMNATLQPREILFQLNDSESVFFFAHEALAAAAGKAFSASTCRHFMVVEQGMTPGSPAIGESFLRAMASVPAVSDRVQTNPDDTAEIIYTTATKGYPMGAELTHFNLFQNALACKEYVQHYKPSDICLNVLPLFHTFGQTAMLNAPLMAGSTVLMPIRFDAGRMIEQIHQDRVTLFGVVPTMVYYMLQSKKEQAPDFSSVRAAIIGGSKMPLDMAAAFKERFNTTLLEGYGLTETSPVVAYNTDESTNRPGSVGKPIWHCEVAIEKQEGLFADTGEIGEVVVRGHNIMRGYYRRPEETREVLRNGWLHTGDLGYFDKEGYLFLTGVKKDLIIRAGLNVYPAEVEMILRQYPGVAEAAVIGLPDVVRGEEVCAVIVADESCDDKGVRSYCLEQLAAYKCPKRFIRQEALPRKEDGTVDKDRLREGLEAAGHSA